jgi:hypothetical protein
MRKETSPETLKDDRSEPNTSPAEERWADRMLPFRQRNLSQSERDRLVRAIRQARRDRLEVMRGNLSWAEIRGRAFSELISFSTKT